MLLLACVLCRGIAANGNGIQAPASFTVLAPRAAATPARAPAAPKPANPDLITRYNLASKLGQEAAAEEDKPKGKAWSQDRTERQANLQRKREEMILAARRKMEEKERQKAAAGAGAGAGDGAA